jgi:hypothetical protein
VIELESDNQLLRGSSWRATKEAEKLQSEQTQFVATLQASHRKQVVELEKQLCVIQTQLDQANKKLASIDHSYGHGVQKHGRKRSKGDHVDHDIIDETSTITSVILEEDSDDNKERDALQAEFEREAAATSSSFSEKSNSRLCDPPMFRRRMSITENDIPSSAPSTFNPSYEPSANNVNANKAATVVAAPLFSRRQSLSAADLDDSDDSRPITVPSVTTTSTVSTTSAPSVPSSKARVLQPSPSRLPTLSVKKRTGANIGLPSVSETTTTTSSASGCRSTMIQASPKPSPLRRGIAAASPSARRRFSITSSRRQSLANTTGQGTDPPLVRANDFDGVCATGFSVSFCFSFVMDYSSLPSCSCTSRY